MDDSCPSYQCPGANDKVPKDRWTTRQELTTTKYINAQAARIISVILYLSNRLIVTSRIGDLLCIDTSNRLFASIYIM